MPEKNDYIAPLRAEAMQYITGERKIIPIHYVNRVRTLIKNECCNYSAGKCVFLDDGEEHACPQVSAEKVLCEWFVDAVLPLDAVLKAEIFNNGGKSTLDVLKHCAVCGKPLAANSNRSKYCPKCALKVHRNQTANYKRSKRLNGSN
ncbi:MAG TPA: cysteine-rich VLP protein [Prolixibacteraceae bacterium]|jgi:hypothetical protein